MIGTALVVAIFLTLGVPNGSANNFWNVWQNWLPDSSGVRSHQTPYYGSGTDEWFIRMSWTVNSHYMRFKFIYDNGSWFSPSSDGGIETSPPSPYDRYWVYYDSNIAKAGCQNPDGLSTVWVNCRNTAFDGNPLD